MYQYHYHARNCSGRGLASATWRLTPLIRHGSCTITRTIHVEHVLYNTLVAGAKTILRMRASERARVRAGARLFQPLFQLAKKP